MASEFIGIGLWIGMSMYEPITIILVWFQPFCKTRPAKQGTVRDKMGDKIRMRIYLLFFRLLESQPFTKLRFSANTLQVPIFSSADWGLGTSSCSMFLALPSQSKWGWCCQFGRVQRNQSWLPRMLSLTQSLLSEPCNFTGVHRSQLNLEPWKKIKWYHGIDHPCGSVRCKWVSHMPDIELQCMYLCVFTIHMLISPACCLDYIWQNR